MMFGLYDYTVSMFGDNQLQVNMKSCLEINMPYGLHRNFANNRLITDYNPQFFNENKKYFDDCDGSLVSEFIYGLELKNLFPDIKGYWCFKSAYSVGEFNIIGDLHLKDKKLKFCLNIVLPNTFKLYVCEEHYLSSVLFNTHEKYCLELRSDDSRIRYIKEAG